MSQNPFEAPRVFDSSTQPAPTGRFEIGRTIEEAWKAATRDLGVTIGGTLVCALAMLLAEITVVGIVLLLPVLAHGFVKLLLNLHDGRGEVGDVFLGFREYGAALLGVLLIAVLFFLPLIPGYGLAIAGALTESIPPTVIGYLLIMVVMFGVMIRFYFAIFFLVDRRMSAMDAMRASWDATQDQKLNTFFLIIVSQIIGSLGAFACGIGLLLSAPIAYLMFASAYRQMTGPDAAHG